MSKNKDIFECAVNKLNLNELQIALEENQLQFSMKEKKYEIISRLLNLIDSDELSEELYLDIINKAFSEEVNYNEGFYYKYNDENIEFDFKKFNEILDEHTKEEKKSKFGASVLKDSYYTLNDNTNENMVSFAFKREIKNKKYDYVDRDVKITNERIKVNIEIDYKNSLIYIHSKNYNNSSAVKVFLEKVLNDLRIDKKGPKVHLTIPKFDGQIVNKWASDNKVDIKGISSTTIHMLDLLSEFENESNGFAEYCIKKIYFENTVIDTEDVKRVKGLIFFGEDIKECIEIAEAILNGKKITGLELSVDYQYCNEELGEEVEVIKVPITILQENASTIRIAISKELPFLEHDVLQVIYNCIRNVYLNKITTKHINNTEAITRFIIKCKQVLENSIKKETENKPKGLTL